MNARALLRLLAGGLGALALIIGPLSTPEATAASRYKLTISASATTTTTDKSVKLAATFTYRGKAVKKATALLQYKSGTKWKTEKKVTVTKGKASTSVKHSAMTRTYRWYVKGKATSKSVAIRFIKPAPSPTAVVTPSPSPATPSPTPTPTAAVPPSNFTISGSGAGHGAGMSQYGAYQMARSGKTTAEILQYYYQGSRVGSAPSSQPYPERLKVQIIGPSPDALTSVKVTIAGSEFALADGSGTALGSYPAGSVTLSVAGSTVQAKVGTSTLSAARLKLTWNNIGTVSVPGAHGLYRYGNLQATVIDGKLNIVNQLAMNSEYLYGIEEMPASWGKAGGAAALQAQVVAARSYLIVQLRRIPEAQRGADGGKAGCDCHVYDDSRNQNFTGWKNAADKQPWRDAVDAVTPGGDPKVLLDSAGRIAETVYYARSGTQPGAGTGANESVWGSTAITYLRHVDDPYSATAPGDAYRTWQVTITQAKMASIFGMSKVASVTISERYPGGLVKSLTAVDSAGQTKTVTKTSSAWTSALGVKAPWLTSISGN